MKALLDSSSKARSSCVAYNLRLQPNHPQYDGSKYRVLVRSYPPPPSATFCHPDSRRVPTTCDQTHLVNASISFSAFSCASIVSHRSTRSCPDAPNVSCFPCRHPRQEIDNQNPSVLGFSKSIDLWSVKTKFAKRAPPHNLHSTCRLAALQHTSHNPYWYATTPEVPPHHPEQLRL